MQRKLKSGRYLGAIQPVDKLVVRILSPRGALGKLSWFWKKEIAEVPRCENDVNYTIKTISQPENVWTLHRNMLMSANHIF